MSRRHQAFCRTVPSRTAASLDGGSSSPGPPDQCFWRCYSTERGLLSGYTPPQTPASKHSEPFLSQYNIYNRSRFLISFLPRCHQIHSTVSWRPAILCEHRRMCCCTSLHKHSRGNTPAKKKKRKQLCCSTNFFCDYRNGCLFVARRPSPRPRGPAGGRLGLRCCFLLPRIPPVHQISMCCCSLYRSETNQMQTYLEF